MTSHIRTSGIVAAMAVLPASLAPAPLQAQTKPATTTRRAGPPRTIAVLAFKNLKNDRKTDWVGEGAAETLTTKLIGVPTLIVIERNQVKEVLNEQVFQKTDLADPVSAVKVGKALGAQRIVIGTFASDKGTLMFNVRVVDVESAVILNAATVTGKSSQTFDTLSKLAEAVIQSFDKKVVIVRARPTAVAAPAHERIVLTDAQKKRLRKQGTGNPRAYSAFAKGMAASSVDEKIRRLTEAIRLDPNYGWAYNNRGNAYLNKALYDRAIRDYGKAIKLNPRSALAYRNRAIAYGKKGLHTNAIKDCDTAIRLDRKNHLSYVSRGVAYHRKGQRDRAIRDYDTAIALKADYALAYYNAIRDYNTAIALKADYALAYYNRGLAYANRGYHERAIKDYDTAILLHPSYAKAHYHKAVACERLRRRIEAATAYRRFLQLAGKGNDSLVRKARGRIKALERR